MPSQASLQRRGRECQAHGREAGVPRRLRDGGDVTSISEGRSHHIPEAAEESLPPIPQGSVHPASTLMSVQ